MGGVGGRLGTHDKQKRGAVGSRCSIVLEVKSKREESSGQSMKALLTSNMPSAALGEMSAGTTTGE